MNYEQGRNLDWHLKVAFLCFFFFSSAAPILFVYQQMGWQPLSPPHVMKGIVWLIDNRPKLVFLVWLGGGIVGLLPYVIFFLPAGTKNDGPKGIKVVKKPWGK